MVCRMLVCTCVVLYKLALLCRLVSDGLCHSLQLVLILGISFAIYDNWPGASGCAVPVFDVQETSDQ